MGIQSEIGERSRMELLFGGEVWVEIKSVFPPTTAGAPLEIHLKNGSVISIKIAFKVTSSIQSPSSKGEDDDK